MLDAVDDALAGCKIDRTFASYGLGDGATLSSVLAFRFDRDRGESKDIELSFGSSEFVHFPHFTRGRDGVENSGFGDSRLGIQRD